MKLSKAQLSKLLDEVTSDVAELLKSEPDAEGSALSKADPGEETPAEETPAGSSAEGSDDEASASAPEGGAPTTGDDSAGGDAPPAGPEASAAPTDGGDPAAGGDASPEALQAEYAKLPPEELKMHFLACKAALMAVMGGGAGDGAPPAGPEASAPPAPPAPAASAPPAPPMGKKEFGGDGSGKVKAGKMAKSEDFMALEQRLAKMEEKGAEVEDLKKAVAAKDETIANLEKKMVEVVTGFKKIIDKTAVRKSISGVTYAAKAGAPAPGTVDLSALRKSDVVKKLTEVTASPTLSKADRDLINSYVAGSVGVEAVAKFLTVG